MNLTEIDDQFTKQYKELLDIQYNIKAQLNTYSFDLNKNEITEAVLNRMGAFWHFNVNNNKDILDRKTNTTAADFFTETCLLFIKSYFENKHGLQVTSEKSLVRSRNSIRPDISIWRGEEVVAVIELKVNDGWKRKNMMEHLANREQQIKNCAPNAYFGVVSFWNFFEKKAPEWNKKYVGLLEWDEKSEKKHPPTGGLVENILKEIENIL
ncbi:hypothetical protein H9Y05_10475 [Crocinitomicaceae bacterium CZZ-1]|uniref:Uncharacterized protein n=1 Tax=Taishania pollutisoli TaxID=2766479 RepID=A0A8J6U2F0_9FLAO|nr:hypothetical protein [Taishania pollutisoli]MBC9812895.1 hypothetical protein [Taishania pollutisoli]